MNYNVWRGVVLIWAHQNIGKGLSVLRDSCQIIVLRMHTSVVGQWSSFLTVTGHLFQAMCKNLLLIPLPFSAQAVCIYRMHPVNVGLSTIYFRGIRILDAVIDALLMAGVNSADHVILTGCSGELCHICNFHYYY